MTNVIDGQVDINGEVLELERVDGIEVRRRKLSVSGTIDHEAALEIGDLVVIGAEVVGRRYRAVKGDGGPEELEVTLLARVVEVATEVPE